MFHAPDATELIPAGTENFVILVSFSPPTVPRDRRFLYIRGIYLIDVFIFAHARAIIIIIRFNNNRFHENSMYRERNDE